MSDGDLYQLTPLSRKLGRHVNHDPRNRNFAVPRVSSDRSGDVRWRRFGAKLNQGDLGACTGFAATHALNTYPLRKAFKGKHTFGNTFAMSVYAGATRIDPFEGEWPPDDTGSTGLDVCKFLQGKGYINRYEWAFGFQQGLNAIQLGALMQGTTWLSEMFYPDADGRIRADGSEAGGHEYLWVGIEHVSKLSPGQNRSWFMNSWSGNWGKGGYFYLTWKDHEALLSANGDLIRPLV